MADAAGPCKSLSRDPWLRQANMLQVCSCNTFMNHLACVPTEQLTDRLASQVRGNPLQNVGDALSCELQQHHGNEKLLHGSAPQTELKCNSSDNQRSKRGTSKETTARASLSLESMDRRGCACFSIYEHLPWW
eukprot:5050153-Amphidinium_carterae.1